MQISIPYSTIQNFELENYPHWFVQGKMDLKLAKKKKPTYVHVKK